ncbi:hypothetical protein HZS_1150, partial [Henneguya salminicola]
MILNVCVCKIILVNNITQNLAHDKSYILFSHYDFFIAQSKIFEISYPKFACFSISKIFGAVKIKEIVSYSNPNHRSLIFTIKTKGLIKDRYTKYFQISTSLFLFNKTHPLREIYNLYPIDSMMQYVNTLTNNSDIISSLGEYFAITRSVINPKIHIILRYNTEGKIRFTYRQIQFELIKYDQFNRHKYYMYEKSTKNVKVYQIIQYYILLLCSFELRPFRSLNTKKLCEKMKFYKCNRDGTLDCDDPTKDKKSLCLEDLTTINPCNHGGVCKHYGNN